jgi:hypothetical protein
VRTCSSFLFGRGVLDAWFARGGGTSGFIIIISIHGSSIQLVWCSMMAMPCQWYRTAVISAFDHKSSGRGVAWRGTVVREVQVVGYSHSYEGFKLLGMIPPVNQVRMERALRPNIAVPFPCFKQENPLVLLKYGVTI